MTKKTLKWTGLAVTGLLVLWLVGSLYLTSQASALVFNNAVSWAPVPNFGYELTFIENSAKQSVSVWEFNPAAEAADSELVILYLHGNSGRINDMFPELTKYGRVYSPAYPGYHESEGQPDTESVYDTALTTYDWLVTTEGVGEENIIIFGHSMGGSPATHVAAKRPNARRLVLANTFSSIQSMCYRDYSVLCVFAGGILNTAEQAREVTIPVRHFAYKGDLDVPYEENQKLFEYFTGTRDKEFVTMERYTHTYPDFTALGTAFN